MDRMEQKLAQLEEILKRCLADCTPITSREVVGRSEGTFKSPTDITRNKKRRAKFENYKKLQSEITIKIAGRGGRSGRTLLTQNAILESDKRELSDENQLLIASHRAAILAAGEVGGIRAWLKFFENYKANLEVLGNLGALPDSVTNFPNPSSPKGGGKT